LQKSDSDVKILGWSVDTPICYWDMQPWCAQV